MNPVSTNELLNSQYEHLIRLGWLELFNINQIGVIVLNENREAVLLNQSMLEFLDMEMDDASGKRFGSLMSCAHALASKSGCGTTPHCKFCGAFRVLTDTLMQGEKNHDECLITRQHPDIGLLSHEFEVSATSLNIEGEKFAVLSMNDVSATKRRKQLEKVFFHDILNTAGGLKMLAGDLVERLQDDTKDDMLFFQTYFDEMVQEIISHKVLLDAENRQFALSLEPLEPASLLMMLKKSYERHALGEGKKIVLNIETQISCITDRTLLHRILGNIIKNALEANPSGVEITITVTSDEENILFSIHNPSVMPHDVKMQIFHRSFSTKGASRGIGTYSIKLFTEQYLHGKVWFTSEKKEGTTFFVKLPIESTIDE
jgi:signal transduction histidine kinase